MRVAIVFDTEFLTAKGAMERYWCGPYDPDPILVQIGAVKLALEAPFGIPGSFEKLVMPRDRDGAPYKVDPHFTKLTGLTAARIRNEGVSLGEALQALADFSGGAPLWSWGKDEIFALAISCYIASIEPPIPATRFGNATSLLLKSGMTYEDVKRTRSNQLAGIFGLTREGSRSHNAIDDAYSIALALQHLLRAGRLNGADFVPGGPGAS